MCCRTLISHKILSHKDTGISSYRIHRYKNRVSTSSILDTGNSDEWTHVNGMIIVAMASPWNTQMRTDKFACYLRTQPGPLQAGAWAVYVFLPQSEPIQSGKSNESHDVEANELWPHGDMAHRIVKPCTHCYDWNPRVNLTMEVWTSCEVHLIEKYVNKESNQHIPPHIPQPGHECRHFIGTGCDRFNEVNLILSIEMVYPNTNHRTSWWLGDW